MTTTAVEWAATQEAEALGHHWLGEEHLLLAVAEEAGCDRDDLVTALADHLERYGPPLPKVGEGCMSAPSYHMIRGRAEGLALSEGTAAPEARHVLPRPQVQKAVDGQLTAIAKPHRVTGVCLEVSQ